MGTKSDIWTESIQCTEVYLYSRTVIVQRRRDARRHAGTAYNDVQTKA
jgi:hypothetical protein